MPVVLVHGAASDRSDWMPNMPALAAPHRVYAPDLIGFGKSPRLNSTYTIRDFADFLRDFMDALGIDNAFLVGHSLGGRVCLEVARHTPGRVDKLVMAAPTGFGRLSILGFILTTTLWALSKAIHRSLPYPPLNIELEEKNLGWGLPFRPTIFFAALRMTGVVADTWIRNRF